jgi:hypothetical protein
MRTERLFIVHLTGVLGIAWTILPSASAQTPAGPPAPSSAPASATAAARAVAPPPASPLAPSSPSWPAPPPIAELLVGGAKQDYEAGRSLYDRGDYAGARSKLQSAYDASGDARLLWDAAACENGMRHYAKAIALLRRYLDSRSPLIAPEAAQNARLFLDDAQTLTAHLDVESSPPHAMVYLDDEPPSEAPLAPDFRVDLGTHRVTVRRRDFGDYTETLTITGPGDVRVRAVLRAVLHQGRLIVRAGGRDPIAVDGVAVGAGNWESVLPSGPHSIVVTELGWPPFEARVIVADNQTRTIDRNVVDVTTAASNRAGFPAVAGIPTWVWLVGGGVLAAGVVTASYVLLKSPDPQAGLIDASVPNGLVRLNVR